MDIYDQRIFIIKRRLPKTEMKYNLREIYLFVDKTLQTSR